MLNHYTQGTLKGKGSEIPSVIRNRKISSHINMVGHEKCIGTLHWSILKIKTRISKEQRMVSVKTSLCFRKDTKAMPFSTFSVYFYNVSPEQCWFMQIFLENTTLENVCFCLCPFSKRFSSLSCILHIQGYRGRVKMSFRVTLSFFMSYCLWEQINMLCTAPSRLAFSPCSAHDVYKNIIICTLSFLTTETFIKLCKLVLIESITTQYLSQF